MRDCRRAGVAAVVGVVVATVTMLPGAPLASATVDPGSSAPTTESPPEGPDTTVEATIVDDTLVGAGDPDTDVDGTVAAIAVVGFLLLVAVAAWWMVRRSDPDAGPMPPARPPPSDLI